MSETIYALATGALPSAIAIIRISGKKTADIIKALCKELPQKRVAQHSFFTQPDNHTIIDDGLVLWFAGPASITGEDYAEFHVHGSVAVIRAFFEYFDSLDNVRQAQAGEFTRRAFDAGKMSLSCIEALQDLIEAETEIQRMQARRLMTNEFSKEAMAWREQLIEMRAHIEADIDFGEDEDISLLYNDIQKKLLILQKDIQKQLRLYDFGKRTRDGVNIVLLGRPNSGKSSLMNYMAKQDVAIVSSIAGTTRDVVEVKLNVGGYPATLKDTAGLRQTDDIIEQQGVMRAQREADKADLILYLIESCYRDQVKEMVTMDISEDILRRDTDIIIIFTKSDLVKKSELDDNDENETKTSEKYFLEIIFDKGCIKKFHTMDMSIKRENLVKNLEEILYERMTDLCKQSDGLAVRLRHKKALQACDLRMNEIICDIHTMPSEIIAENLRSCEFQLAHLIGYVDIDEILGAIFSRFCIGK